MSAPALMTKHATIIMASARSTEGTLPIRRVSTAAGIDTKPNAMKKANVLSCASVVVSVKIALTDATSGSISDVMNPQAKNNVVTVAKATPVDPPRVAAPVVIPLSDATSRLRGLMITLPSTIVIVYIPFEPAYDRSWM